MTQSTYSRIPERAWIGTKVKLLHNIKTKGGLEFKAGEILTITAKQGGFTLQRESGEYIRKVHYSLIDARFQSSQPSNAEGLR